MKVLVADDSPVLRAAVTKLVESAGYEVATAVDGVEAITRFYEEQPDLVLLDIQMPKLTGYVVCRLMKEDPAMSHVPVLILTGRDTAEDRYWGAQSGADGYLTKDSLGEGLVSAIRSTLATRALAELSGKATVGQPVLGESDVLTRVCEMLDRKLFEATVVNELTSVGTKALGLRDSVAEILRDVHRLVRFDAGAIALSKDLSLYLYSAVELTGEEMDSLYSLAARQLQAAGDREVHPADLRIHEVGADPEPSGDAAEGWSSFYSVPLKVRGSTLGVLLLAARAAGVFTEAVYRTLRTIESPIAAVVDSAVHYQEALAKEASQSLSALYS